MSEPFTDLLKQQDLSNLRLQEMSMAERAELCRRYEVFVQHFGAPPPPPQPKRKIRKWVPGKPSAVASDAVTE